LSPSFNEAAIDGEVVALEEAGRPSVSALQNYGSSEMPIPYYIFDVMVLEGVDVMREPLSRRRELLEQKILPSLWSQSNIPPNWILTFPT
jgi:ATP-dependent DNA ligase